MSFLMLTTLFFKPSPFLGLKDFLTFSQAQLYIQKGIYCIYYFWMFSSGRVFKLILGCLSRNSLLNLFILHISLSIVGGKEWYIINVWNDYLNIFFYQHSFHSFSKSFISAISHYKFVNLCFMDSI